MAKSATANNDFDPAIVNSVLLAIDGKHADLMSERGTYMSRCKVLRDDIKGIYDDAKAKGIPTKALKTLVAIRINERKNTHLHEDLEPEDQDALARLAATEECMSLPLWRISRDAPLAEMPTRVSDDPQGLKNAKFKPLN